MDAIDTGLVGKLAADATLTGLAPGGVWYETAPQNTSEPFVIVSQLASEDDWVLPATRRFDDRRYLVKAVQQSASASGTDAAAARVDALLEAGTITATGYQTVLMRREVRVRYLERDGDLRWQHSGGEYRVLMRAT